ncbi:MAG: phage tail sheath subtilisin-like domain-containing protein [Rhodospirillaceae bacterium]|nr:phage tail sheath subtilisin-like domain-containing protein [Rhodospirillales bacterium]
MTFALPQTYNHGARRVIDDSGARAVVALESAVIGLVGTAPDADETVFPLNTPVAILADEVRAAKLGQAGTLPDAMRLIYAQAVCWVVVVRVAEGQTEAETDTNVIGGVGADGTRKGFNALLSARGVTNLWPRILIAPGFTHKQAVLTAFVSIADRLRGWIFPDGPNTTSEAAVAYRAMFSSRRVLGPLDPWLVIRADDGSDKVVPSSPVAAGLAVLRHHDKGYWWSMSNQVANGVLRTARPIDFMLGDVECEQNYLNSMQVNTWIQDGGVRLWGDDTCADDNMWLFWPTVVADDIIGDSLVASYKRLVDQGISRNFFDEWVEQTNFFLRDQKNAGALIGFKVWVEGDLNTPTNLASGKAIMRYSYRSPTPARDLIVISKIDNAFFEDLFKGGV